MKKTFVSTVVFSSLFPAIALAQAYYNGGYSNIGAYGISGYAKPQPSYTPAQAVSGNGNASLMQNYFPGSSYYAPQQPEARKQREIGSISVGADYVLGYASYETVDYTIESALNGGNDYTSDTRNFDRSFNSISLNIGWRPLRYVGIEAFYSTSLDEDKVTHTESYSQYPEFARGEYTVSYKVYGLDLLGYVPINDDIEFIASIGVGKYDATAKVKIMAYEGISTNELRSTSKEFEDSSVAYRIGGGFQIWLSKHLTLRVMGRWSSIGGDFMSYITEINAGVRYHF